MCLAVPARVIEVQGSEARVEVSGVRSRVLLDLLPEAVVGDFVLVHAGFAIGRLDPEEARETLAIYGELGWVDEPDVPPPDAPPPDAPPPRGSEGEP